MAKRTVAPGRECQVMIPAEQFQVIRESRPDMAPMTNATIARIALALLARIDPGQARESTAA